VIVGLLTALQVRIERYFDWTVERRTAQGWFGLALAGLRR
jgi:hypothetical protein